jgi:hypothetical protein
MRVHELRNGDAKSWSSWWVYLAKLRSSLASRYHGKCGMQEAKLAKKAQTQLIAGTIRAVKAPATRSLLKPCHVL